MKEIKAGTNGNTWGCMAVCSAPCYIACAAGAETGPAALAIVTGSMYYANIKNN
ncbi:hypothetical protein [Clostridium sp. C8-1-8]|uniref:hypothetical protein n=1 Tax=Clostridium sp. C8-1-8 TaxID=2698831 RepID=UPI0013698FEA|nr:hypothetical protein [Clostridium sp. C8-1-8]